VHTTSTEHSGARAHPGDAVSGGSSRPCAAEWGCVAVQDGIPPRTASVRCDHCGWSSRWDKSWTGLTSELVQRSCVRLAIKRRWSWRLGQSLRRGGTPCPGAFVKCVTGRRDLEASMTSSRSPHIMLHCAAWYKYEFRSPGGHQLHWDGCRVAQVPCRPHPLFPHPTATAISLRPLESGRCVKRGGPLGVCAIEPCLFTDLICVLA
jgi:hypothetical protein